MTLLTPELRAALRLAASSEATDKRPLVKLFNPLSAATWRASWARTATRCSASPIWG